MAEIELNGPKQMDKDKMTQLLESVIERREQRQSDEFESKLLELAKPRQDQRLPVTAEDENEVDPQAERRPAKQVVTRLATHPLYVRIPEMEREWRSPESDLRVQQWLVAFAAKDTPARLRVEDDIDDIYGRQWEVGDPFGGVAPGTSSPLVPIPLLNLVMINRDRAAKIPGMSTGIQLTSMGHRVPLMDQATVGMVAEGSEFAADEPTLSEKLLTSRKMQGHAIISLETLADSAFNTVGLLSQRMGQAMGQLEDVQACTSPGTGANITESIHAGLTPIEGGITALTYGDVASIYFSVGQPYRQNAVWYVNAAAAEALTKIASTDGYPIFSTQAALAGAIIDDSADGVMFRKNVFEVPLVGTVTTNGDGVIVFMDPSVYGWGRREGMTARTSDSVSWSADAVNFKFTQRVDAIVLDVGGAAGVNASRIMHEDLS